MYLGEDDDRPDSGPVVLDCWRFAENWQVARPDPESGISVDSFSAEGARKLAADHPGRKFIFAEAARTMPRVPDDWLFVSRAQAIHDCLFADRPEAEESQANLLVVSIGADNALLARVEQGMVVEETTAADISLCALSRVYAENNGSVRRNLREFPDAEPVFRRYFRDALCGRFSNDGPLSFFGVPDLSCCRELVCQRVNEFDPDRVCTTVLTGDWAGLEALRVLFPRDRTVPARGEPFELAYRGFLNSTFDRMVSFLEFSDKVREQRSSSTGPSRAAFDTLWRAVRECAAGYCRPRAYLPVLAVLDRHRDEMKTLRKQALKTAGLAGIGPRKIPCEIAPDKLEDYRYAEGSLPENVELAVRLGGRVEITALETEGYIEKAAGERLAKPEVVVRLEDPEIWKQTRLLLREYADMPPAVHEFLKGILAGKVEREPTLLEGLLALLDFLQEKRAALPRSDGQPEQARIDDITGRIGFWLTTYDFREVAVPDVISPVAGGLELYVSDRSNPDAPPQPVHRGFEPYEGRLFPVRVLRVGYRDETTGAVVRRAQVVVETELDRLVREARPVVERAAADGVSSIHSIAPSTVRDNVLEEMARRRFDFKGLDKTGKEPDEQRRLVMRFLDIIAVGGEEIRAKWMTFLGLEFYEGQKKSKKQLLYKGIRSRRTGRVWQEPYWE